MALNKQNDLKKSSGLIPTREQEFAKFDDNWEKAAEKSSNIRISTIKNVGKEFFKQLSDFPFESREPSEKFFSKFQTFFAKQSYDTILLDFLKWFDMTHVVETAPNKKQAVDDRQRKLLRFLMNFSKKPLSSKGDLTPLIFSLENDIHVATETILQREDLKDALEQTVETAHGTCIHVAIEKGSPFLGEIIEKSSKFPDQFLRVNEHGNTPLHMLCEHLGSEVSGEQLNQLLEHEMNTGKPQSETGLHQVNGSNDQQSTLHDVESRLRLMNQVLELSKSVLKKQNKEKQTAYQLRVHTLTSYETIKNALDCVDEKHREKAERKIIAEDPIAAALRDFCIRKCKSRDEMMACLYQSGEERHLEFDLTGFSSPSIREEFLDRLAQHIQFETVLRYVALPKLIVEPSKASEARGRAAKSVFSHFTNINFSESMIDTEDRNLELVFEWLRKNGVTKIIKIVVIDHGHGCHNDSAIKRSLKGFQVEFWNWKKMDICSDVISSSTGVVKEVSLYWSGNSAVMMGWASERGFLDREKFPELKEITIFCNEGYEEPGILEAELRLFSCQMKDSDPLHPIHVNVRHNRENRGYATDFTSSVDQPISHKWLDAMESFSIFLRNMKVRQMRRDLKPVRIAIIDDGIDASQTHLQRRIAKGKSFSPYANSSEFVNAYFIPQGRHGTLMADLICRTCPEPKLYVARLEEHLAPGGGRRITVKSAADAIEWAVSCDVDIISMSWTFDFHDKENPDMKRLKSAIDDAKKKEILLFQSTSDQGDKEEATNTSPFAGCFRIGGASALGKALTWVNLPIVDYLFPGKQIPFKNEDQSITHETGSSLATACATGLAGALLYCERILNSTDESMELAKSGNMEKVFKKLRRHESKFVDAEHSLVRRLSEVMQRLQTPPSVVKDLAEAAGERCAPEALRKVFEDLLI